MVTNNKVLTVSYGTFSCTLEGFDDSFDTMKAIAEYFRDLAADDRYFGAEPPTPDAEMLTRIAEREIERRVQARQENGTLVLSASDAIAPEVDEVPPSPEMEDVAQDVYVAPEGQSEVSPEIAYDPKEQDIVAEDAPQPEAPQPYVLDAPLPAEQAAEADENLFEDEFASEEADAADDDTESEFMFDMPPVTSKVAGATDIAAKLSRIRAVVNRSDQTHDDDDSDDDEDTLSENEAFLREAADEIEASQAEADSFSEEEPSGEPAQARARVIRMKKAELDEALESGIIEETPEENTVAPEEDIPAPDANEGHLLDTSLSAEDEAELLAELADVEQEAEAEMPTQPARRDDRAVQLVQDAPQDEAVDRLIEETNTKLDEPEGNRRRTAIAHLRRAVEATKAEKEAGVQQEKADDSAAYREDLADVMQPHKSDEEQAPKERRATPLKLVAEQRVEEEDASGSDAAAPEARVQPRRVAADAVKDRTQAENERFIGFAESHNATGLPEVVEAACAYAIHVQGRRRFSRPSVMRFAYLFQDKSEKREDCLRAFGQLLRDGKIEKVAGGRFTVSDKINYAPEDREAS